VVFGRKYYVGPQAEAFDDDAATSEEASREGGLASEKQAVKLDS
jgi:hypothetical protein